VGVPHRPGVGRVAAAGEAEALADGLADDLGASLQDPRHDGRVDVGDVPLEHARPVHQRHAGDADVVLDGNSLARKLAIAAADRAAPVPGVERVLLGRRPVTRRPWHHHLGLRLRQVVEPLARREHARHQVAVLLDLPVRKAEPVPPGQLVQRLVRWRGHRHQSIPPGIRSAHGRAPSSWAASWSRVRSSPKAPIRCVPIGNPSSFQKSGTDIDGCPVWLATKRNG
jgi:hypothetical protein